MDITPQVRLEEQLAVKEAVAKAATKIRELLGVKERWTQHFMALAEDGQPTYILPPSEEPLQDRKPVCFCLMGAVNKVQYQTEPKPFYGFKDNVRSYLVNALMEAVRKHRKFPEVRLKEEGPVIAFNDHKSRTHSEIVEVLDSLVEATHMEVVV